MTSPKRKTRAPTRATASTRRAAQVEPESVELVDPSSNGSSPNGNAGPATDDPGAPALPTVVPPTATDPPPDVPPTPELPVADPAPVTALLQHAVEEAARLLDADGAIIYLLDQATGVLSYAFDAGISGIRDRRWVRRLQLPLGAGMFGIAAAERRVTVTGDYPVDATFRHSRSADRFVAETGLRSMVVAPLVAGDRVFGAMGTFASRPDAFGEQAVALVRSLADHAAAAMANAILIDELAGSQAELERRAEAERALREIATRISAIHAPADVIQQAVDEAARLLGAGGARIDLIDPTSGLLRWAYQSGADRPSDEIWPQDPDEALDQGVSGKAVTEGRVFSSGDYLTDDRFIHRPGPDSYIRSEGIKSVMAAPLPGDGGPFGALTVYTTRLNAWTPGDAAFLEALATETAIAHPERPADRGAGTLARGPRPARGRRADAPRDRRPDHGDPGSGRDPPAGHRRGHPPAAGERRDDQPGRGRGHGSLVGPHGGRPGLQLPDPRLGGARAARPACRGWPSRPGGSR